jgi:hypothetical protein
MITLTPALSLKIGNKAVIGALFTALISLLPLSPAYADREGYGDREGGYQEWRGGDRDDNRERREHEREEYREWRGDRDDYREYQPPVVVYPHPYGGYPQPYGYAQPIYVPQPVYVAPRPPQPGINLFFPLDLHL